MLIFFRNDTQACARDESKIELVSQHFNVCDFNAKIELIQIERPRWNHVLKSILPVSSFELTLFIFTDISLLLRSPAPLHRRPHPIPPKPSLPVVCLSTPASTHPRYMHSHGECEWKRRRQWEWRRRRGLGRFEPRAGRTRGFRWSDGELSAARSSPVARSALVLVSG